MAAYIAKLIIRGFTPCPRIGRIAVRSPARRSCTLSGGCGIHRHCTRATEHPGLVGATYYRADKERQCTSDMKLVRVPSKGILKSHVAELFGGLMDAKDIKIQMRENQDRIRSTIREAERNGHSVIVCFHSTSAENTAAIFERGTFDKNKGSVIGYGFRTTFFAVDPRVANYYSKTVTGVDLQQIVSLVVLRPGDYALRGCTGGTLTVKTEHISELVLPLALVRYPAVYRTMVGASRWALEEDMEALISRMEEHMLVVRYGKDEQGVELSHVFDAKGVSFRQHKSNRWLGDEEDSRGSFKRRKGEEGEQLRGKRTGEVAAERKRSAAVGW